MKTKIAKKTIYWQVSINSVGNPDCTVIASGASFKERLIRALKEVFDADVRICLDKDNPISYLIDEDGYDPDSSVHEFNVKVLYDPDAEELEETIELRRTFIY